MNVIKFLACVFVTLGCAPAGAFLNLLKMGAEQSVKGNIAASSIAEKQNLRELLSSELQDQKAKHEGLLDKVNKELARLTGFVEQVQQGMAGASALQMDFLNKKLALLNETRQMVLNVKFTSGQILVPIEQNISQLENFLKEPDFASLEIADQSFYSYADFKDANKKVISQEEKLALLRGQQNEITAEEESLQQRLGSVSKEREGKKKEQQDYFKQSGNSSQYFDEGEFDFKERGELIDLQKNLYSWEKRWVKLKLDELSRKNSMLATTINIEQERFRTLRANLEKIRRSLRIDQNDIRQAREQFDAYKKATLVRQEEFYKEITQFALKKEQLTRLIEQARKKYKISESFSIADWGTLQKTSDHVLQVCSIGVYVEQAQYFENKIDLINSQIDEEKIKLQYEKIDFEILVLWSELLKRKGRSIDPSEELKRYQALLSEVERKGASFKEKRNAISSRLDLERKNTNNIKLIIKSIPLEPVFSKLRTADQKVCLNQLKDADSAIHDRIEDLSLLLQNYVTIIDTLDATAYRLETILNELEKKSIWQRSEYAISIPGIKNIASDLLYFMQDTKVLANAYWSSFHLESTVASFWPTVANPMDLLIILVRMCIILALFFLFRRIIDQLRSLLSRSLFGGKGMQLFIKAFTAMLAFVRAHYTSLFCWALLFVLVKGDWVQEPIFEILFYLGSILYFCYITYQAISYFVAVNHANGNIFFGDSFEQRFVLAASIFGYSTAILIFVREAFVAGMYYTSELPTILLAAYSIILRGLLIFSVGRDELVRMLPARSVFWSTCAKTINKYYYPILAALIALMILSDPYVGGYSNLVSYFFWGMVSSIVLAVGLLALQSYVKTFSTYLFMYSDDEALRERFSHARTWYGLFVVAISVLFLCAGLLLGLWVWGYEFSWYEIKQLLHFELFSTGIDAVSKKQVFFTPHKLLVVLAFILTGLIGAVVINRFVVTRIFQLLPVDLGIQHMVTNLVRYLVMLVAIFIGFQWAGLGTLLIAIGLVIGSIGYLVREPLADFLSYFIILVQRPVKIGDLVMIGEELGFVRHITPRSVVLRAKNSYTLIVPNSLVISQSLKNWNYTRGYVAFDDITLTIPYAVDPVKAKEVIVDVLSASHLLLKIPAPIIRLENFGENGYEFLVRGFVSSDRTSEIWEIASDLRLHLVQALRKNGILIAVPTRAVVTMRSHKPRSHSEYAKMFEDEDEE